MIPILTDREISHLKLKELNMRMIPNTITQRIIPPDHRDKRRCQGKESDQTRSCLMPKIETIKKVQAIHEMSRLVLVSLLINMRLMYYFLFGATDLLNTREISFKSKSIYITPYKSGKPLLSAIFHLPEVIYGRHLR